jgi:hypothetical protein
MKTLLLLLFLVAHCHQAYSRSDILVNVPPGTFSSVDESGTVFLQVRLDNNGKGSLQTCDFIYPERHHGTYTFTWTSNGILIAFKNIKRLSRWDDGIFSMRGEWGGTYLRFMLKGYNLNLNAQLFDTERLRRVMAQTPNGSSH